MSVYSHYFHWIIRVNPVTNGASGHYIRKESRLAICFDRFQNLIDIKILDLMILFRD
ncbi:hypothetical protein LCGC14_0194270 [marine sediment metagenome]|uniref:Uncharacterized protein n=1 Tax=marine sediment metagenome TaxID=412755 RepID=A0A0F9XNV6_9ZZZZ